MNRILSTPADPDRTLRSRFEIKYLVDPVFVPAIRRFFSSFVRPDPFTKQAGAAYELCSLYLDSPGFMTYQMTAQGMKNRFKVRVRSYSDDPLSPVFCEIKQRVNQIILKRRGSLDREHLPRLLAGYLPGREAMDGRHAEDVEEFRNLVVAHELRPVARVRYRREAYQAPGGEPLRITIDTDVEHALTSDSDLLLHGGSWTPTRLAGTILEVKFNHYFPSWIRDLVHTFQLQQRSVPKYCLSIDDAFRGRLKPLGPLPRANRFAD